MFIERNSSGIKVYPFADTARETSGRGYIEICARDWEEFKGKVSFNIGLENWWNKAKWAQFQAAVEKAFELAELDVDERIKKTTNDAEVQ